MLGLVLCCCSNPAPVRVAWTPMSQLNRILPPAVQVFGGSDPSVPLRAWYVHVQANSALRSRVLVASDADNLETGLQIARRAGALVLVNAGYFRVDSGPARHVGLLLVSRNLLQAPLTSVIRDRSRYFVARAALGFLPRQGADIAWVVGDGGVLYEVPEPIANAPGSPGAVPGSAGRQPWPAIDAVAAGPRLIADGRLRVSADEEGFFGSETSEEPRTAAGVTAGGDLILMVVDGRQRQSRGVSLRQLAALLLELGCVDALNLDGGGSSTLVVNGTLVNRPLGGDEPREIMSALAVLPVPSQTREGF